jgi:hypothetical protein
VVEGGANESVAEDNIIADSETRVRVRAGGARGRGARASPTFADQGHPSILSPFFLVVPIRSLMNRCRACAWHWKRMRWGKSFSSSAMPHMFGPAPSSTRPRMRFWSSGSISMMRSLCIWYTHWPFLVAPPAVTILMKWLPPSGSSAITLMSGVAPAQNLRFQPSVLSA